MWGTQPEAEPPPVPDRPREATPPPVTPLLVVGAPGSDLAGLKAMLAPLGQPVLETALKTPLTPLHLKLTALSRELPRCCAGDARSQALQRNVEVAKRQVHKMSTLINALLDVSRLSRGKLKLEPADTDLGEVLEEVAAWFAPEAARAGSELRVDAPPKVHGWWDRLRLEQVVTNLVSNAIRYGAGRPIHAHVEVVGENARLVVRDEGIGIPPEALERIFGKFERAVSERHSGGLGLGLYITHSIVEAMGGVIQVESRPGQGSTFTVELPRSRQE
jgi:signal transduction histidine kinase